MKKALRYFMVALGHIFATLFFLQVAYGISRISDTLAALIASGVYILISIILQYVFWDQKK